MRGEHTELRDLTVLELVAVDDAILGDRQYLLYLGEASWTKRDRKFLDRLRRIRGVTVLEGRGRVTITGSLLPNGLTRDM